MRHLFEPSFRFGFRAGQRHDDRDQEAEGHRDQAGVPQRKWRRGLAEHPNLNRRREVDQHEAGDRASHHRGGRRARRESAPEHRQHQRGEVRAGRDRKRQADHVRDVLALERQAEADRDHSEHDGRDPRHAQLFMWRRLPSPHDVDPQVVRQRRRAGQREAGNDREDRRKRHGRDEAEKHSPADDLGQQGRRHVAARVHCRDRLVAHQHHRAKAEHEREQVERPDEPRCPVHRDARGPCVGHCVETHQDMRQARGAEHQGEAKRDGVERVGDQLAWTEHAGAVHLGRRREQPQRVEAELREHQTGQHRRTQHQQHGLDDLHPRRGDHPAEEDVGQHHAPDDDDRGLVAEPEEQPDQVACADHLRDQVERHDRQAADRGGDAHRALPQPECHDVGKGVLAEVAQRLGDEKQHDRPADQKPDRVDQPVEARQRHQAGDAEKAGRAHVVARQREPVLEPGDRAPCRVEVIGAVCLARGPPGDAERQRDENQETGDRDGVGLAQRRGHRDSRIACTAASWCRLAHVT